MRSRRSDERPQVRLGLHAGGQVSVWKSPARFKVVAAGRRWGKTHLDRTWLLKQAFTRGPGRYWYVGPTREDAKDIMWEALKEVIDPSWIARGPSEVELSIDLRWGQQIRIWSAEKADALRGRPLKALVLDEFANQERRIFHEILRPSLADFRSPALITGTPQGYDHFHELFDWGQDGRQDWASWQFRSIDNPLFDQDEIAAARRDTDPRTFRQEYEASFETVAGRAYYAFNRSVHRKPVELLHSLPVAVMFDFNVHPATAVIGQKVDDEARAWREVWVENAGGEATKLSAMGARELLEKERFDGEVRIYGDPSGQSAKTTGPSDHQVVKDVFKGMNVSWRVQTRAPHVKDRVAAVNTRCESMDGAHHMAVDPSCKHLITDLEQVVFKDGDLDQKTNPLLTHVSSAFGYWIEREFPVHVIAKAGAARVEYLL